MLPQAKWPTDDLGIARERAAEREAHKRFLYQPPCPARAKVHRIAVDLRTGKRTVYSPPPRPPKPEAQVVAIDPPVVAVRPKPEPKPVPVRIPKAPMIHRERRGIWMRIETPRMQERVKDVIRATAEAFDVTPDEMLTPCRKRRVAWPRFAAMHVMRSILRISLPSIGRVFKRDHTSCMHALTKAALLRRNDPNFAGRSRIIARELRRRWAVSAQEAQQ